MPCFHPIEVGIRRKSIYSDRGVKDLQVVPCGSCIGCRSEQGRQWAVRMMHESRMHRDNLFVTLTYDEEEIPDNGSLVAKDLSGFIKNLRKRNPDRRFSFFGCGEYGERTQRPHYHALLFGFDFLDRHSSVDVSRPDVWGSETLDAVWGRGRTEIGSVTMASARYVAGYIGKKQKARDFNRANPLTGELLSPEFARMSLRPAIGRRWIEKYWSDVYPRDFVVVDGKEFKPPRYYDKFMDEEHPVVMEEVRQARFEEAMENPESKYSLDAKEAHAESRAELYAARVSI